MRQTIRSTWRPLRRMAVALSVAGFMATVPSAGAARSSNPFEPPVLARGPAETAPQLPTPPGTVRVIILGKDRKTAVIDGKIVRQGDPLRQWTVTGISDSGIQLRHQGINEQLTLRPGVRKTWTDDRKQQP